VTRRIRVLVGKPGLDGHDRGAKVVAAALRDSGMEVIYTGLHQSAEQVVEAAVQEDVDVVALSILSGAHMTLFPEVLERMRERGIGDRLLTGGGIIPAEDMETLAKQGVGRLFGPGTSTQDIAAYIHDWCAHKFGNGEIGPLSPARSARAKAAASAAQIAHHAPEAPSVGAPARSAPARARARTSARASSSSARPRRKASSARSAASSRPRSAASSRPRGAKRKPAPRSSARGRRRR